MRYLLLDLEKPSGKKKKKNQMIYEDFVFLTKTTLLQGTFYLKETANVDNIECKMQEP